MIKKITVEHVKRCSVLDGYLFSVLTEHGKPHSYCIDIRPEHILTESYIDFIFKELAEQFKRSIIRHEKTEIVRLEAKEEEL